MHTHTLLILIALLDSIGLCDENEPTNSTLTTSSSSEAVWIIVFCVILLVFLIYRIKKDEHTSYYH